MGTQRTLEDLIKEVEIDNMEDATQEDRFYYYQSLRDKGFSEEEAMKLVNTKIPNKYNVSSPGAAEGNQH